ncbi:MAG: prephenate dehydrogenase [Candidatus Loosdrechtia sp.]|uniref:prephenate dehydrogenase n=1 Tax=Candidatus Loosdrechtia sp. TaxID=3101272 RepID=UPI003A6567CB|nr:MAG: prephenate dehydrogenase/arogenate dehydrogenase family protein [Candidatus Jettenia sp. AMX2]
MQFDTICIIGPGLIGGSIGLGLKKRNMVKTVIGVCHRASSLEKALKMKAIDVGIPHINGTINDADIVILATSVSQIVTSAKEAIQFMKGNAILTDVGSTKGYIVEQITQDIKDDITFVGAHPIAGSEKRGVEFASPDLFEGSLCIITPSRSTGGEVKEAGQPGAITHRLPLNYRKALETISCLWQLLGANIVYLTPEQHDEVLSYVSHLPHLIASCLINTIKKEYLGYGGNGLKDTTRIASGDPGLWVDIFGQNRKNIIQSIDRFIAELTGFKNDLLNKDDAMLLERLKMAKLSRDSIFNNNPIK